MSQFHKQLLHTLYKNIPKEQRVAFLTEVLSSLDPASQQQVINLIATRTPNQDREPSPQLTIVRPAIPPMAAQPHAKAEKALSSRQHTPQQEIAPPSASPQIKKPAAGNEKTGRDNEREQPTVDSNIDLEFKRLQQLHGAQEPLNVRKEVTKLLGLVFFGLLVLVLFSIGGKMMLDSLKAFLGL